VNPVDLLHEDHISDYASGPETESDQPESMEEWRVRMGGLVGVDPKKNEAIWDQTEFWERIDPLWRSDEASSSHTPQRH
jgi:hypothetical protein